MVTVLRLLARLPLSWLHGAGAALGWIVFIASPAYARHVRENIAASGIFAEAAEIRRLVRASVVETGKGALELVKVWFGKEEELRRLADCSNWGVVSEQRRARRGIIFLTPHLGCFEMAARFIADRMPITVLYRPPRLRWLEPLMIEGRKRGLAQVVPANLRGVRTLYKQLQRGEAVGLLPDQAPQFGEGVWADFFGRPAYTMTLVRRLQKQTSAAVILVLAERLPHGRGYVLHFERYAGTELDERELNLSIERLIRRVPGQYLWGYDRHKVPHGVKPPVS